MLFFFSGQQWSADVCIHQPRHPVQNFFRHPVALLSSISQFALELWQVDSNTTGSMKKSSTPGLEGLMRWPPVSIRFDSSTPIPVLTKPNVTWPQTGISGRKLTLPCVNNVYKLLSPAFSNTACPIFFPTSSQNRVDLLSFESKTTDKHDHYAWMLGK